MSIVTPAEPKSSTNFDDQQKLQTTTAAAVATTTLPPICNINTTNTADKNLRKIVRNNSDDDYTGIRYDNSVNTFSNNYYNNDALILENDITNEIDDDDAFVGGSGGSGYNSSEFQTSVSKQRGIKRYTYNNENQHQNEIVVKKSRDMKCINDDSCNVGCYNNDNNSGIMNGVCSSITKTRTITDKNDPKQSIEETVTTRRCLTRRLLSKSKNIMRKTKRPIISMVSGLGIYMLTNSYGDFLRTCLPTSSTTILSQIAFTVINAFNK